VTLQPGIFNGVVVSHKWGTSGTGSPFLAVTVEIDDGFGTVDAITGKIYFTPKAKGMARGQLKALGFNPDEYEAGDIGDTVSLVGNECSVELDEQEFRGRTELRVARFGANKPPSKEELAKVTRMLREAKGKSEPAESPLHPPKPAPKPANGGPKPLDKMSQAEVNAELEQADDGVIPF
jgi:hypothetical protein